MTTKTWAQLPPGLFGAAAALALLAALLITGQQLLWLPLSALMASLALAWAWPNWVLSHLKLQATCLTPLRQGELAQWQLVLSSRLPLWGLQVSGPLGLCLHSFIPGRSASLILTTEPLMAGSQAGDWRCAVRYPFDLWRCARILSTEPISILPGLEPIEFLPLSTPDSGQVRRALVCFDSQAEFTLGEDINQSPGVQLKLLANLCRALAAKGYEVNLATSHGLLTAPAYSSGFAPLDHALLNALSAPAGALDLLARYNLRPDAHLVVLPQWLGTAETPDLFPGQSLWQLLFDEERFTHPLSRSKHFHRRLSATHWQWVIEPQQPLARLFYVR